VVLALLGYSTTYLLCQQVPTPVMPGQAQAMPGQTMAPAGTQDPTRPEIQPKLDTDRDPAPSPDVEDNAPVSTAQPVTTGPVVAGQSGAVQNAAPKASSNTVIKALDNTYTLHTDVDEVLLNCTVVNENGQAVLDLGRGDFRIWEDGVAQTATSFVLQDLPVSIGIVIDNSGSMRDKRAAVNAAALDLLRASNPLDVAFIVNFSDRAYLDQGFTSNIALLDRGLAHFDSRGTTALYDAVAASADELSKHAKNPKQVLLVITDGGDNASRLSMEQTIRRVQDLGGPVIYTIGMLFGSDKEESQRARSALVQLSQETGGIAYFPHSLEEVDSITAEVARDIRTQYTIGYHSTKPASLGGYRTVSVEAKGPKRGKLTVRTRRGYYAKNPVVLPLQAKQENRQ
jgi:Ca-activated chloride channel family protein